MIAWHCCSMLGNFCYLLFHLSRTFSV
jgi:hypothetical protein